MKVEKYECPSPKSAYKTSNPATVTVISNTRLTEPESPEDIRNIVLNVGNADIEYIEGQSIGIIPPGTDGNGKPYKPRLYSIASARRGDDMSGTTITICVKRVNFIDPESGKRILGVASNYLCDLKEGDTVKMIGPVGRSFVLPVDMTTDLIMFAVGTGIAPYRAFIHHIYREKGGWKGKVRLFYGSKTGMESLFMNRVNKDIGQYLTEDTFRAYRALSRVEDDCPEKGYVQHRLKENQKEIWKIIKKGNFCIYICGLKGLEKGLIESLEEIAAAHGEDWELLQKKFKAEGRWNIEVY